LRNFNLDWFLEIMLTVSDRVSDLNFSVGKPPQVHGQRLRPVAVPHRQKRRRMAAYPPYSEPAGGGWRRRLWA